MRSVGLYTSCPPPPVWVSRNASWTVFASQCPAPRGRKEGRKEKGVKERQEKEGYGNMNDGERKRGWGGIRSNELNKLHTFCVTTTSPHLPPLAALPSTQRAADGHRTWCLWTQMEPQPRAADADPHPRDTRWLTGLTTQMTGSSI